MSAPIWVVFHADGVTGEVQPCEVDGGICYEAYRDRSAAFASADESNADAVKYGWNSRYFPSHAPAGLRCWIDGDDTETVAGQEPGT